MYNKTQRTVISTWLASCTSQFTDPQNQRLLQNTPQLQTSQVQLTKSHNKNITVTASHLLSNRLVLHNKIKRYAAHRRTILYTAANKKPQHSAPHWLQGEKLYSSTITWCLDCSCSTDIKHGSFSATSGWAWGHLRPFKWLQWFCIRMVSPIFHIVTWLFWLSKKTGIWKQINIVSYMGARLMDEFQESDIWSGHDLPLPFSVVLFPVHQQW